VLFRSKSRLFALAVVLAAFGFGITLNIMNVDGFITQQNITRASTGSALDVTYLVTLSNDAVPALAFQYRDQALPQNVHEMTGAALACKAKIDQDEQQSRTYPWPSYLWSRETARQIFSSLKPDLNSYTFAKDDQERLYTMVGNTKVLCEDSSVNAFSNTD
jgi:hypothetical protein